MNAFQVIISIATFIGCVVLSLSLFGLAPIFFDPFAVWYQADWANRLVTIGGIWFVIAITAA